MAAHKTQVAASRRLVTIGQVIRLELAMVKICGGFLLHSRRAKFLRIGYKLATMALTSRYVARSYVAYEHLMSNETRASVQNISFFWSCQTLAMICALACSLVSSIRNHNLLSIVLNKRLDARYLGPPTVQLLNRALHQLRPGKEQPERLLIGSVSLLVRRVSRLTAARVLCASFLISTAASMVLRNEFDRLYMGARSTAGDDEDTLTSIWAMFVYGVNITTTTANTSISTGPAAAAAAAANSRKAVQWSEPVAVSVHMVKLCPEFLLALAEICLLVCHIYGHMIILILVSSALADMLRYAREQESAHEMNYSAQVEARAAEGVMERSGSQSGVNNSRRVARVATSELLIQVRDVLLGLRAASSLDYLFFLMLDVSRLMAMFSLFSPFIASNQFNWVALLSFDYLRLALGMFVSRAGYYWLHNEARLIEALNERRLVESSLSSGGENNKTTTTRNSLFDQLTRVEAATNYRLARDIQQIWPTDWFAADLRSFVSQNIFVVTFVATLQQLIEASAKLDNQRQ